MNGEQVITIDQWIAEWFNSNFGLGGSFSWGNIILCAISLIIAVVLCSLVGYEREKRGRAAGLRTHLLVGVGSCLIMIISIYGFPVINLQRDVARLAAGVVAGVGFLGAGAIVHKNGGNKGLTTAASIWLVSAIGLACGSMNFILAIGGTLIVLVVLIVFKRVEVNMSKKQSSYLVVTKKDVPLLSYILEVANELEYKVSDISSREFENGSDVCIEVIFTLTGTDGHAISYDAFRACLNNKCEIKEITNMNG